MTISNKVMTKKRVNSNEYSNNDTGEVMSSELPDGSFIEVYTDSGNVKLTSDNYVTIDSDALAYAIRVLKKEDLSRLLVMSNDLRTSENAVYNNTEPHTNESLQEALGFSSRSAYMGFIKRVTDLGFVYKLRGRIRDTPGRYIYKMNPYFARKKKFFKGEALEDIRTTWE